MMKASELVSKALDIAKNDKTLYVMGCFGAPMTAGQQEAVHHQPFLQQGCGKSQDD